MLLLFVPLSGFGAEPEVADVFVPKADGFASIRIPSVVVSKKGTLLAFAEGRAANADQAKNKIVLKRSTDGGKSWGKVAVVAEDGDKALNNPCAVVEREGGQVLLVYQSYPAGVGERSGKIQPGYDGDLVVRNWLITSDDDGMTWTKPRDITKETKREKIVTTVAGGPGVGIQLRHGKHAGRILMPFNEGPFGVWNIYAVYSDDKGKTWKMGDAAPGGLIDAGKDKKTSTVNEAQFAELKDGSIRFNVRRWAGKAVRKTCVSEDGGVSWSKVEDVPELVDPGCMGSVLRYTDPADRAQSRILFSGPQSTKRENGMVFVSYDEGKTWPTKRVLCKDSFAYSCLTALQDGTIGCLYEAEGTSKIVFARFTLDWLEEKVAPLKPAPAFSLPVIDLNDQKERQVLVDREKGQYLGHPTTLLLEDGKTILCVYPKGRGRGPILYKRSEDGGKTWSDRLPTPKNWETSLETPTMG
ncbi:MAG: exo-alpha-sialidase [Planctomycetaceae bacterium]|nr:exo-alpha-sialidase [Planctomycetaceae bacterium]